MSANLKSWYVGAVNEDQEQGLCLVSNQGPSEPFPPLPAIQATIFNRSELAQRWPGLKKTLEELQEECAKISYPFEMAGVVESRRKLAGMGDDSEPVINYGKALVLNLSAEFECCLAELAVQKPSLVMRYSLNKRALMATYDWSCTLGEGKKNCLMVPAYFLYKSGINHCFVENGRGGLSDSLIFVPVVFVSGNSVACGGFWFDGNDGLEEQAASYSSGNYKAFRHWNEEELEQAAQFAEQVGSSFPWEKKPWLDKTTGSYLTCIFVKCSDE